ncbi:TSUP family transporter [Pelagerythrobacter marensis]|uniref:Probable membrane transporter protein n=1 Tax=Pelagerythrobacter marensis TaxID=543877 RepID=A0A0G3X8M4_9SPHN|nr:TSUP family transporter [Pelagerythrobacter marensis]AKM07910.1 membrane protein [Pelagerythrobacter marensis]
MELTVEMIGFLVAVAFVAGTIDAIAGGGGLLTLPALLAVGASPAATIGTNKLQSTFGVATAVLTFARKGRIDFRRFAKPALAAFLGSAAGAFVLTRVDPTILSGLIPVLLVAMAIYYALKPNLGDEDRHVRARPILLLAFAAVIGCYDGFFGPGAGSFYTTALIAVFGLGTINAIAHTKLLNFSSNLASLMVLLAAGEVMLVAGLLMAVASMAGAFLGAHSTMRFGTRAVRPLLIIMCLGLTANLLSDPANPLTALITNWLG